MQFPKITTQLRLTLNRSCQLYTVGSVPPTVIRENLYQLVLQRTHRRYEHDQVEMIVEGFMEFWELT